MIDNQKIKVNSYLNSECEIQTAIGISVDLIKNNYLDAAEEICNSILNLNNENFEAFNLLGEIYLLRNLEVEAHIFFDKANLLKSRNDKLLEIKSDEQELNKDIQFENEPYKLLIQQSPHFNNIYPQFKPERLFIEQVQRISFQLSNICNYSTVHRKCPLFNQKVKITLPSKIIKKTIDELAEITYSGIIAFHIYNEPLIDPRLFMLIDYAKSKSPCSKIYLLTNGLYLDQNIIDELYELKIWLLVVSAYSKSEFYRLSKLNVTFPYRVFLAKLDNRQDLYTKSEINITKPCFTFIRDLSVDFSGNIILCCLDWKQKHIFGNLYRDKLADILQNPELREANKNLIHGNRNLYLCSRCDWVR